MSNNTLFMVIGGSIVVIAAIILICYLKYKGVNTLEIVQKIKSFFTKAETYTEAAEGLTEGKAKEILQAAEAYEKLAVEGADYAEQMLLSMQIKNDTDGSQRRTLAQDYIYAFLNTHGIAITDDIKTIVQGIVEKTVLSDKTIDEVNKKIDDLIGTKVEELQKQVDSLTLQITQLITDKKEADSKVLELTNKLNSIQSAVK